MAEMANSNTIGRRFALCVGIGQYTHLSNRNLRYAASDAEAIASKLRDPQRGLFSVTLLSDPTQTTKQKLDEALDSMLNDPSLRANDLVILYFSCHGQLYTHITPPLFYLLPSNAELEEDGLPKKTTVIDIYDLTKVLAGARVKNILFLLDVCHSGGTGAIFQHLRSDLGTDNNLFILAAAREDRVTSQSSLLKQGLFTHCLLRAFEQRPNKEGWLTISQLTSFVSDEIRLVAKDSSARIHSSSIAVDLNLPVLRNPY